jgi:hypothetical protein
MPRVPVHLLQVSSQGDLISYSYVDQTLRLFSINGQPLAVADTNERVYTALFSEDGHVLVTGGDRQLCIRNTHDFAILRRDKDPNMPTIRSLATTADEQHLLVGLQTGVMLVYALDAKILRDKTLQKLTDLGF